MQKGFGLIWILLGAVVVGAGLLLIIFVPSLGPIVPLPVRTMFLTKGSEAYCRQFGPGGCPSVCELNGPSCPVCTDIGTCHAKGIRKSFSSLPSASPAPTGSDASSVPNGTGETANWKTYTNQELAFTIKYPPILSVTYDSKGYKNHNYGGLCPDCPEKSRQEYTLQFFVPLKIDYPLEQPFEGFYLDVIDNPENYSLRDFVENLTALDAMPKPEIEYKQYIVDGVQGITYGIPYQGGITKEILVQRRAKFYHFFLQFSSPERGEDLHKSIATFRFLE